MWFVNRETILKKKEVENTGFFKLHIYRVDFI
uniref:Uncharacterized protein n=1 Tax=Lepeophtheirus salmonis TaxID=72036 RepID=A0A0K2UJT5_LEPSM